ncbi:MAG: hypothetical protein OEM39_05420, partial [Acidimicrobiia bacterium]|nr:hypothetical protein [Acidimicrobiia bacterium]
MDDGIEEVAMGVRLGLAVVGLLLGLGFLAPTPGLASIEEPTPDTIGLVDPSKGLWYLRAEDGWVTSFYFGNPGDDPFVGDWDCDGVDTPGLRRPSDGFVYLRNSNTAGIADIQFYFGDRGDVPIAGDFDGDGCDTVSVYRPSESRVFIINELGQAGQGLGSAEFDYYFGNPGDQPFVGDFDGDGVDTVGLHRATTGLVYFRNTHTAGPGEKEFTFGDPGDRLVAGDWGFVDGIDTPAVYRPADTTVYFRHTNTEGVADRSVTLGGGGWLPVAGDFGLSAPAFDRRMWSQEKVAGPGDAGRFNTIEISPEGVPVLAYGIHKDFSVQDPYFARCLDPECTRTSVSPLFGVLFESTSIAFDGEGLPIVTYFNPWTRSLWVAECQDVSCTVSDATQVARPPDAEGKFAEAGLAANDTILAVVSNENHYVDVAARGAFSSAWSLRAVESLQEHSRPSLAIGPEGFGRMAIPADVIQSGDEWTLAYPLVLVTCGDATCSTGRATLRTVHTDVPDPADIPEHGVSALLAAHTSIALLPDGSPVIAFHRTRSPGLQALICDTPNCSSPTVVLVDPGSSTGMFVDVAVTPDGLPIMAFTDETGDVLVAHCRDTEC